MNKKEFVEVDEKKCEEVNNCTVVKIVDGKKYCRGCRNVQPEGVPIGHADQSRHAYGNEGEKWVMTNILSINGLMLNEVGTEFEIAPYYSVPHGYTSIKYEGILIFIPDKIFEEHFVRLDIYKQYYNQGDIIKVNANGNLGDYTIDEVDGDGRYITLRLERNYLN